MQQIEHLNEAHQTVIDELKTRINDLSNQNDKYRSDINNLQDDLIKKELQYNEETQALMDKYTKLESTTKNVE